MKILVVIDMQNDFICGALGTEEAAAIVPAVREKIENFEGEVIFTRDTHGENYLETQEGRMLPVKHCIQGSIGWEISETLAKWSVGKTIDKPTFASVALAEKLEAWNKEERIESIELAGLCTDICVISNALLLKAHFPEVPIKVDPSCCAGVNPQSHIQALKAMQVCQIQITDEIPIGD